MLNTKRIDQIGIAPQSVLGMCQTDGEMDGQTMTNIIVFWFEFQIRDKIFQEDTLGYINYKEPKCQNAFIPQCKII